MIFEDGVGAFLVRGPYCQLDVGLCEVDMFLHWKSSWRLKTGPSRRHLFQPAEGPVLDPPCKRNVFERGSESRPAWNQKWSPLEGPSSSTLLGFQQQYYILLRWKLAAQIKPNFDPLASYQELLFFVRVRCLSAGLRSWVLLADERGIEPPPAVCQRHKSAAILTEPRGRLRASSCFEQLARFHTATAFRFGQGHCEAVSNQKRARQITRWSVWQPWFWGCDMTLGTLSAASKVHQKQWNHKRQEGWHKHPCAELGRAAFGSPNSIYLSNPKTGVKTNRTI